MLLLHIHSSRYKVFSNKQTNLVPSRLLLGIKHHLWETALKNPPTFPAAQDPHIQESEQLFRTIINYYKYCFPSSSVLFFHCLFSI